MNGTYDPGDAVTIRMPNLWQWFKAGVGLTLGAGVAASALWVVYMVGVLPFVARAFVAALR